MKRGGPSPEEQKQSEHERDANHGDVNEKMGYGHVRILSLFVFCVQVPFGPIAADTDILIRGRESAIRMHPQVPVYALHRKSFSSVLPLPERFAPLARSSPALAPVSLSVWNAKTFLFLFFPLSDSYYEVWTIIPAVCKRAKYALHFCRPYDTIIIEIMWYINDNGSVEQCDIKEKEFET